jgi:hypothetical protein
MHNGSVSIGSLSAKAATTVSYRFTVNFGCPPGTRIPFSLSLTSGSQTWQDTPPDVVVKIPAPDGLSVEVTSTDSVSLTWNPVSGAAEYKVYYAASETGQDSLAGTSGGNTSFTHTELSAGTIHYYRVTALGASGGESEQSAAVPVKTWMNLPAFNQAVSGTVSAGLPEYYRFPVSSGIT